MSLPASVGTFTVTGTVVHPDGGARIRSGTVLFELPYPVQATTDHVTVIPATVAAPIVDGDFTTPPLIDPNDPDISPQGWTYNVRILSEQWTPAPFRVEIPPGSAGEVLHLDSLPPAVDPPAVVTYALVSQVTPKQDRATLTVKGDLYVATAAGTVTRLPRGANGQVLTVDSTTDTGLKYAAAGGGGGGGAVESVNGETGDVVLTADGVGAAHRILRVRDMTLTSPAFYDVPDTGSSWALLSAPGEYSIPAAIGEDIEVVYSVLCQFATVWSLDLAVVTGATPTRQRYLVTNTSTPSFEGNPADYSNGSGASFQGRSGTLGFKVEASDLDGGSVRFRWVVKSSAATGRLYASPNYPLILSIRNSRTPAA